MKGLWTSPRGEAYDGHLVKGKKSGEVSYLVAAAAEVFKAHSRYTSVVGMPTDSWTVVVP